MPVAKQVVPAQNVFATYMKTSAGQAKRGDKGARAGVGARW